MAPSGGCVLAFDFGLKHLGVAVGQTVTRTASPLTTLRARQGIPDWQELTRLVDEWSPQLLVVGLPLNMDGTESEMAGRARAFAAKLGSRSNLPVVMVDERLTSYATRNEPSTHAAAAALIAQTYLAEC
jgi:putative Holliday junction resolvase